ncbi:hypothetical protein N7519_000323 [Penicillium mononematosum]|uniref:uncharacterized protein n=1 Tax=Penicillium mononematosum TaxID=268346 RepID=UPI002548219F|nr:uncharacterized protein N7519_000323 [Penicillium mononematosum]KAJ6190302.1 hypothetical protein N7519_000323 [Penicillium mononematosum]
MPPPDRCPWRNVHFYNASNKQLLGGFYQAGSLTEANLLWILGNVLLPNPFTIRHRASGRDITPSNNSVTLGDYDIFSDDGAITVTNEEWVPRVRSHSPSDREDSFRDGIRQRDGKCVISGNVNELAQWDWWAGFETAHVVAPDKENLWIEGESKINSPKTDCLWRRLYTFFFISISSLLTQIIGRVQNHHIDGRVLDPVCRRPNNPNHVADDFLRWHFRQSVLANVRGAGEPTFETDFPPGTDKMATLRDEPYGKERFEMELERRLGSMAREEE